MEYIILGCNVVLLILVLFIAIKNKTLKDELNAEIGNKIKDVNDISSRNIEQIIAMNNTNNRNMLDQLDKSLSVLTDQLNNNSNLLHSSVSKSLTDINKAINDNNLQSENRLNAIRDTIEKRLSSLQDENSKKLDEMRNTVDEKLQKTLEERISKSFNLVSERLEQVYKGLGEMQTLANGVGDLKKVLSNVKTRGILGEIQLGAILEEILSNEQYELNVATIPGSSNRVEYAIKLPGDDDGVVYLPIDSKFPAETYSNLIDALDIGDITRINECKKILINTLKSEAKDIRDKYVEVPYTTEFAIMFLPFEGLYAEAVNMGLVEILQRDYKVNIAGPTTMAALLNSLQMGFKTLAIQRRSGEVWKVLNSVRSEFDKFQDVLQATQNKMEAAQKDLEKLVGTRTRMIQSKLSKLSKIDDSEDDKIK